MVDGFRYRLEAAEYRPQDSFNILCSHIPDTINDESSYGFRAADELYADSVRMVIDACVPETAGSPMVYDFQSKTVSLFVEEGTTKDTIDRIVSAFDAATLNGECLVIYGGKKTPGDPTGASPHVGVSEQKSLLVPRHSDFDWLAWRGRSGGKALISTKIVMLRARLGSRRMRPARSSESTMPWTDGGVTPKCRCRSASAGGRSITSV